MDTKNRELEHVVKAITEQVLAQVRMGDLGRHMERPRIRAVNMNRRPRRTVQQLKEAMQRALDAVRIENPDWDELSVMRKARFLVKRYKVS